LPSAAVTQTLLPEETLLVTSLTEVTSTDPDAQPPELGGGSCSCSTVQLKVAGVWSVLPDPSVARTPKLWAPTERAEYALGLVHADQAEPSSWQAKVEPLSLEEKEKLALVEVVVEGGEEETLVSGGVVSGSLLTVQLKVAGVWSVLPDPSVACTAKLWAPSERPE